MAPATKPRHRLRCRHQGARALPVRPSETTGRHARAQSATQERTDRGTGSALGAPWKVIVLNDNHNTFQGVAFALSATIPGVSYDQGLRIADRIHNSGRAIVWSGHRETAELYWEQLKGHGLTMAPLERS